MTGPKNYRPMEEHGDAVIVHTATVQEIYGMGIVETKTLLGNVVRAYDMERTVCDFIKRGGSGDGELYIKVLRGYSSSREKDIGKLMDYARRMGIEGKVRTIMGVLLNED